MHVHQTDLHFYLAGRATRDEIVTLEEHVFRCGACRDLLASAAQFIRNFTAPRLASVAYRGPERRREQRIPTQGIGLLRIVYPTFSTRIEFEVVDVSNNGLRIRTLLGFEPGSILQLQVSHHFILAEVRYCIEDEGVFDSGLQIIDMQTSGEQWWHVKSAKIRTGDLAEEEGFEPPSESPR